MTLGIRSRTDGNPILRNRLAQIDVFTLAGVRIRRAEYKYDAFDRRIETQVDMDGGAFNPVVTDYVYDGDDVVLARSGAGAVTHRYLHGPLVDQVLADEKVDATPGTADDVRWALADHQQSVRRLVKSDGTVVTNGLSGSDARTADFVYDSFGRIPPNPLMPVSGVGDMDQDGVLTENDAYLIQDLLNHPEQQTPENIARADMSQNGLLTGLDLLLLVNLLNSNPPEPSTTPDAVDFLFGYTGQQYDKETGLSYYKARYYDPFTSHFLSEDPAHDGVNPYRYVGNDPLNRVDPTGLRAGLNSLGGAFGSSASSNFYLGGGDPLAGVDFRNLVSPVARATPQSSGQGLGYNVGALFNGLGGTTVDTSDYSLSLAFARPSAEESYQNMLRGLPYDAPSWAQNRYDLSQSSGTWQDVLTTPHDELEFISRESVGGHFWQPANDFLAWAKQNPLMWPLLQATSAETYLGLAQTALPESDPGTLTTYWDPNYKQVVKEYNPGEGPSSRALAEQALLLAPLFQGANALLGSAFRAAPAVESVTPRAVSLVEAELVDEAIVAARAPLYEVNLAKNLRSNPYHGVRSGTVAEHAPQTKWARDLIPEHNSVNKFGWEPAIRVSEAEAAAITRAETLTQVPASAREALAIKVRILRNNTGAPTQALKDLIRLSKETHRWDYRPLLRE